ncbi:hypothetical protein B0H17DRAFT_1136427 [Mycena rosella]|uniref:Uncharacterized protein n=1 Tax=Mycena rosella TaxID=1033263 RepID=A0AAD7DAS3_MYCRO|nr:hypothetical protein B0H17DRAFT_1136427 [Mycena rosella]
MTCLADLARDAPHLDLHAAVPGASPSSRARRRPPLAVPLHTQHTRARARVPARAAYRGTEGLRETLETRLDARLGACEDTLDPIEREARRVERLLACLAPLPASPQRPPPTPCLRPRPRTRSASRRARRRRRGVAVRFRPCFVRSCPSDAYLSLRPSWTRPAPPSLPVCLVFPYRIVPPSLSRGPRILSHSTIVSSPYWCIAQLPVYYPFYSTPVYPVPLKYTNSRNENKSITTPNAKYTVYGLAYQGLGSSMKHIGRVKDQTRIGRFGAGVAARAAETQKPRPSQSPEWTGAVLRQVERSAVLVTRDLGGVFALKLRPAPDTGRNDYSNSEWDSEGRELNGAWWGPDGCEERAQAIQRRTAIGRTYNTEYRPA